MSPPKTREGIYPHRYPLRHQTKHSDPEGSSQPSDESEYENFDEPRLRRTSRHGFDHSDSISVNDLSSSMERLVNISSDRERSPGSPRHQLINQSGVALVSGNLYPSLDDVREKHQSCNNASSDSTQLNVSRDVAEHHQSSSFVLAAVFLVLIFLVISVRYLPLHKENVREEHLSNAYVEDIENNLRSIFRNQSPAIWRVIRSQLSLHLQRRKKVTENRPLVRPAVLLVVGNDPGLTMRCFSRKLGVYVAQAFKRNVCVRADAEENSDSGHVAKWQMDQVVGHSYKQGDRCFHVQRLGSLSGPELLMLHAWCDGDFSPYKDAVFIISLMMKNNVIEESEIESYLNKEWIDLLGADEAPALLSRIANSIVVIKEEEPSNIFKSHCLT